MEQKRIKVQILLKESQRLKHPNSGVCQDRWGFTHYGEKKEIISRTVEYYSESYQTALGSYVSSEVDHIQIDGMSPGEPVLDYKQLLVKSLTNVNKAYLLDAALGNVALYGVGVIDYQEIIDLCTEATIDLKQTILALEILKEKKGLVV